MIVRFEASFAKDLRGITDKTLFARVGQIIDEVKEALINSNPKNSTA